MDRRTEKGYEPQEPASQLAGVGLDAIQSDETYTNETRVVVLVYPNDGRGGVAISESYDEDVEKVVADVLQSCDALLQTVGRQLRSFDMDSVGGQG